jgi:hypothetical protein
MRRLAAAICIATLAGCGSGKVYTADEVHTPVVDGPDPATLRTVASALVEGRTGPGERPFEVAVRGPDAAPAARRIGTKTFPLALRTDGPSPTQYPCTGCHVGETTLSRDRVGDAHANIRPVHPHGADAGCTTCHAPNVEELRLIGGERVPLARAYRLCAQCHAPQAEAWAGGAHGKRLDGWRGRRVVMGCADCHDPHAPPLESRIPFRPPVLSRPAGRVPGTER